MRDAFCFPPEAALSVTRVNSASHIQVLGPVPVPGAAGREGHLWPSLGPAYVFKRRSDDDAIAYAVILGAGLGRRALMDLLYALAPYKAHGPDRFARVLDNWRLHDRALASANSESLLRQHADSLKLSWQVFTDHRDVFVEVFEDETERTRVVPAITWEQRQDGTREWRFDTLDAALTEAVMASVPAFRDGDRSAGLRLDALAGLVAIPYLQPSLYRGWRPWQSLVRNGKSNYVGPASVPVVAHIHRRSILNSRVILTVEALEFAT